MVLTGLAGWGLAASPAFAVRELEIESGRKLFTDRAALEAAVGEVALGASLFLVEAARIEGAVSSYPAVRSVEVVPALPGTLRIRVEERRAALAWLIDGERFAIDDEGLVLGRFPVAEPGPSAGLVAVVDRRAGASLSVGTMLDPVLLDAATRLGSLTPSDIGSAKRRLRIALDDRDGFTVQPLPGGPVAVFGFYTPSLRTPELIPGQVRLLRSILVGREATLGRVMLASESNGAYLPTGVAPAPLPTPRPTRRPTSAPDATSGSPDATSGSPDATSGSPDATSGSPAPTSAP